MKPRSAPHCAKHCHPRQWSFQHLWQRQRLMLEPGAGISAWCRANIAGTRVAGSWNFLAQLDTEADAKTCKNMQKHWKSTCGLIKTSTRQWTHFEFRLAPAWLWQKSLVPTNACQTCKAFVKHDCSIFQWTITNGHVKKVDHRSVRWWFITFRTSQVFYPT